MLDFCAEGRGFDPRPGQGEDIFLRLLHLALNLLESHFQWFLYSQKSRTNFNLEEENVTGYRYITHLYCLAVQAGFYSDVVECWILCGGSQVRSSAGSGQRYFSSPITFPSLIIISYLYHALCMLLFANCYKRDTF